MEKGGTNLHVDVFFATSHSRIPHLVQDREAVTLLNQTAQCVLKHVRAEYPDTAQDITAAEFWAHLRGADSGHQLHVDTDESLLQAGEKSNLPHPVSHALLLQQYRFCIHRSPDEAIKDHVSRHLTREKSSQREPS